ncbi:hypothetical protein BV25DRAFT_1916930 [Artomyces pyxidatus]|uniref:Uncharacterized protein n=1 Tax=Artomyces pyxidatus TaxID=48021 RepID=A0ACB8T0R5_9AGAM|nr:hypothetical protein BV25DRAFT_1916930 [Artomyces pyxidatus]
MAIIPLPPCPVDDMRVAERQAESEAAYVGSTGSTANALRLDRPMEIALAAGADVTDHGAALPLTTVPHAEVATDPGTGNASATPATNTGQGIGAVGGGAETENGASAGATAAAGGGLASG